MIHRCFPSVARLLCLGSGFVVAWSALAAEPDAPTGGFVIDAQRREQVRNFFNTVFRASENVTVDWTGAVSGCVAGEPSVAFREATLRRINYYRAMAGVPAEIAFDPDLNNKAQQAALVWLANPTLDENPRNRVLPARCLVDEAQEYFDANDLPLSSSVGPDSVRTLITSPGDTSVGPRRRLLFPSTITMGSGDTIDLSSRSRQAGSALWIAEQPGDRPDVRNEFVAWPPNGHLPVNLVPVRWSFALPNASFANARISITFPGATQPTELTAVCRYSASGNALNSNCREVFESGFGENALVFRPTLDLDAFDDPLAADQTYAVTVTGVQVGGAARDFSYDVTLIDPARFGDDTVLPEVTGPVSAAVGGATAFQVSDVPDKFGLEWRSLMRQRSVFVDGAERGPLNVVAEGDTNYSRIVQFWHARGQLGFRQVHASNLRRTQVLTLVPLFYVNPGARLEFQSLLGYLSQAEVAKVQVSGDDGLTWTDVWSRSGHLTDAEIQDVIDKKVKFPPAPAVETFTRQSADLKEFVGEVIRVRFVLGFGSESGKYNPTDALSWGWYIDDIRLPGADRLIGLNTAEAQPVSSNRSLTFSPRQPGEYLLQARAQFFGAYPAEWGPYLPVVATPRSIPTPRFGFRERSDVAVGTTVESNAITPVGLGQGALMSVVGGEYAINDRPFRNTPSLIRNGDRVRVRVKAAAQPNTATTVTLTIGGSQGTFTVTSAAG